ncbi:MULTISPECIES: hypothetical protein [unclassified Streptomyces]|uniref:hypothetical protein n=1 Tax=unclassified Streptomyces TaxID=2593676 RepID=UPI003870AA48
MHNGRHWLWCWVCVLSRTGFLLCPFPRPVQRRRGRPLRRPRYLYADRGYDHKVHRFQITTHLARRGTRHGSGIGVYRWVVGGAITLLHWFRRLRIRWEIRDDIHRAFVTLGRTVICWRRLRTALCRA